MAWANSKVFAVTVKDSLGANITSFDIESNTFKAALYNNTTAPDNTVTAANTAYAVGQWVTGNEVSQAGQWAVGGVALASVTWALASATVTFDAADTASGAAATLANVYGALVYDDTVTTPVADQGLCYNYFGGVNSVTSGTLTVVWNASGIAAFVC